jgi:uncharacterized YokU family protein
MHCEWCSSTETQAGENTVYWELPDGSRAITITNTPCIQCHSCEMVYQTEDTVELIKEQLILIHTKKLELTLSYEQLMNTPRWLKMNYFGK